MTFRVAARTLLHLGAELISSDGVAFYELIKNSLDAGSSVVRLEVVVVLSQTKYHSIRQELKGNLEKGLNLDLSVFSALQTKIEAAIDSNAPNASEAFAKLRGTKSIEDLVTTIDAIFEDLNHITVSDTGTGMSLPELNDIYLTIGTPNRLIEREQWKNSARQTDQRPILGEKGVGRLSAMRLGDRLAIETSKKGETHWNILDIDWQIFTEDIYAFIEDISIEPEKGRSKDFPQESGTTIRISKLSASWTREKLDEIVRTEFSKLVDPFVAGVRFPVKVFFNNQLLEIPRFNRELFDHAHATIIATYEANPEPRISGRIWYIGNRNIPNSERETYFEFSGTHLISLAGSGLVSEEDININTLRNLGSFVLTLYWYNRQRLSSIDGIGNQRAVRNLLSRWAGGVMVYRDGFRVGPYGDLEDDWLDLDRRALSYKSFKVNRAQIIGKVDITAIENPLLLDQTNREGLRDTPEKRALVALLKWLIEKQLLLFLNDVDKEKPVENEIALEDIEQRIQKQDSEVEKVISRMLMKYPALDEEYRIRDLITENRRLIKTTLSDIRQRAEAYETGRSQLVHLAGVGLMVEVLAHELNRATSHTLDTLKTAKQQATSGDITRFFSAFEAQLRSLQKRLRTLDPLSTRGRQHKETFDLVSWVSDALEAHYAQFQRHGIRLRFEVVPNSRDTYKVSAVKGMIVQILENLISNSVYWLKQQRKLDPSFLPEIHVVIDIGDKQIRFSDNGPGIEPRRKELVFQAFHSTKPVNAGNGLGLYIAREIAEYHGATLYLKEDSNDPKQPLRTFIFELGNIDSTK
jgi:signal transduction histidine kinase